MASHKSNILRLLKILETYTDAEHPLQQNEIANLIKKVYDVTVGRHALRRDLESLIEIGYPIE